MNSAFGEASDWVLNQGLDFVAPFLVVACIPVAVILFVLWFWLRAGRRVALPYDGSKASSGNGWWSFISCAESMLPIMLGIVGFVLCIPLSTGSPIEKRSMSNIQFCVDCSGSMMAQFGEGDRYDASMAAINDFLDYRAGDAFGLTFFASSVVHWCPLTTDTSAFRCAIPFMKPNQQRAIGSGTRIGMALEGCRDVLGERDDGDKMIILVSDGQSGDLAGDRAEAIAKKLLAEDITVFGIHIGGGEIPEQILTLTNGTNGAAFLPGDTEAFEGVFRKIDEMKPAEIELVESEKIDHYRPWCIAALTTLFAWSLTLLFGVRYTPW